MLRQKREIQPIVMTEVFVSSTIFLSQTWKEFAHLSGWAAICISDNFLCFHWFVFDCKSAVLENIQRCQPKWMLLIIWDIALIVFGRNGWDIETRGHWMSKTVMCFDNSFFFLLISIVFLWSVILFWFLINLQRKKTKEKTINPTLAKWPIIDNSILWKVPICWSLRTNKTRYLWYRQYSVICPGIIYSHNWKEHYNNNNIKFTQMISRVSYCASRATTPFHSIDNFHFQ